MTETLTGFATRILQWYARNGRHGLPWHGSRDPYRVWLSEIMLQQTQVATVAAYFNRFVKRFPDVQTLAAAPLDDVMALWSGLGYYSRARNLHYCAIQIVQQFGGQFPHTAQQLQTLPGIGRSTAAAVSAFCFGERAAVLDANVKRVLTRVLGFGKDLAVAAHEKALWLHAESLLPTIDLPVAMPHYTQGLMDLGATICTPRNPSCEACPVCALCIAKRNGQVNHFPVKSRKLKRATESLWLLQARSNDGAIWLHRRPITGIWAGLHCLPIFGSRQKLVATLPVRYRAVLIDAPVVAHALTHKNLLLHPVTVTIPPKVILAAEGEWYFPAQHTKLGLPAPIRKLLNQT